MKNRLLFCSLILALTACKSDPAPDQGGEASSANAVSSTIDDTYLIRPGVGMGVFTGEMSGEQLSKLLGSNRVKTSDFYMGEGQYLPGLTLYPGTKEAVEVLLDEDGMPIIYQLEQAGSKWATAKGLKVGSTLEELEKINGKPLKFYGFDWDYGGAVTNWQGGTLAEKDFMVVLGYKEGSTFKDEDLSQIMGDQEVVSNNPVLGSYTIIVKQISQRY